MKNTILLVIAFWLASKAIASPNVTKRASRSNIIKRKQNSGEISDLGEGIEIDMTDQAPISIVNLRVHDWD